jgi:glutathione S-transferase
LKLISHKLCPYVQRAVIALTEKCVPFERIDVDLANKPEWFLAISPLGQTPVLQVGEIPIFESAVILEYLEETQSHQLHPADPLSARTIAPGSNLDRLCSMISPDSMRCRTKRPSARGRHSWSSALRGLNQGPPPRPGLMANIFRWWTRCTVRCFAISTCSMKSPTLGILSRKPKLLRWRSALATRPSVRIAVGADYPALLRDFLGRRNSWLSDLQARAAP